MELICKTTRRPDFCFHRDGRIEISRTAARALGMVEGDVLTVVRIGPGLAARIAIRCADKHGRHSGECHPTNKGGEHFRAYSVALCRAVFLESCEPDVQKLSFKSCQPRKHRFHGTYMPLTLFKNN